MRKMTLDMDQLVVDSFEIAGAGNEPRGTVRGNAATLICSRVTACAGGDTCQLSCLGSCLTGLNCQQIC